MNNTFQAVLIAAAAGLFLTGGCIQSAWAESPQVSSDAFSKEMLSRGLGLPPYRMEISVQSAYGLRQIGTEDLLRDCLKENLMALGEVEFVEAVGSEKPPAVLRLRVWFTEEQRAEGYECFDITMVVVVGKIMKTDPKYEAVLDAYALAGVKERDLEGLCNKIATRFDLKILSDLRTMRQSSKQR